MNERQHKCSGDMDRIDSKLKTTESLKSQIISQNGTSGHVFTENETKEIQKLDAFKEHKEALTRHIENTQQYLLKEVAAIESKVHISRELVMEQLGIDLLQRVPVEEVPENQHPMLQREIKEVEEEEEETEDYGHIDEARTHEVFSDDDLNNLAGDSQNSSL